MAQDLYAALGVSRAASHDEIKKAYRGLARRYHPDKAPGDEEAARIFKDAAEAWRVLGDAELRARYDAYGLSASGTVSEESPGEIFEEIFGKKRAEPPREPPAPPPQPSRRPERGEDLRYRLALELKDIAFGAERTIGVTRRARCGECRGTGARPGVAPVACVACGGSGSERVQQGFFASTRTCARCGGVGRVVEEPCEGCKGTGEVHQTRPLKVSVPAGVAEGTRLRVSGEGEAGKHGGPPGDLFVVVELERHPFLEREGNDLTAEVPIRFAQAALGASIEVPTLEGVVRMRVPAGSQSGRVFRLKGKGLPGPDGVRGDQRVRVVIDVPDRLGADERETLERLDALDVARGSSARAREYAERLAQAEPLDPD